MRTAFALHHLLIPLVVLVVLLVGGTLGYKVVGGWDLDNHLVVCGFGRMGRLVCEEFSAAGLPFVVIDRNPGVLQDFLMPHGIPLGGDATADEVLKQAGVGRARALVSTAASDADNLIVAIKKPDGKMLFNPGPESELERGDVLITLGHRQQLDRLESLAGAVR